MRASGVGGIPVLRHPRESHCARLITAQSVVEPTGSSGHHSYNEQKSRDQECHANESRNDDLDRSNPRRARRVVSTPSYTDEPPEDRLRYLKHIGLPRGRQFVWFRVVRLTHECEISISGMRRDPEVACNVLGRPTNRDRRINCAPRPPIPAAGRADVGGQPRDRVVLVIGRSEPSLSTIPFPPLLQTNLRHQLATPRAVPYV